MDALNPATSLTARRQAASSLPAFELPPPPTSLHYVGHNSHRIPPLSMSIPQPAQTASVPHILTPPSNSNSASDVSSTSSGIAGTTPNTQSVPVLPYTPSAFWPTGTPTGFNTGFTPQPWQSSNLLGRNSMFSPPLGNAKGSLNSPATNELHGLPPPPVDIGSLPPYLHQMHSAATSGMPTAVSQSYQMPAMLMHSSSRSQSQLQGPSPVDHHPKSMYHEPSSATSQTHPSYSYSGPSPTAPTPVSMDSGSRISPHTLNGAIPPIQHHQSFIRPPYPSYSLPAMPGPVMANVNSPNGNMSLIGSVSSAMLPFHSGAIANPHGVYGTTRSPHGQQQVPNDRPFRCDQCPQSFNRNHDLKRHKRIHLAVKPFPCGHCEKTFSRKDALKRHILVKVSIACILLIPTCNCTNPCLQGCGKGGDPDSPSHDDSNVKSESSGDHITNVVEM